MDEISRMLATCEFPAFFKIEYALCRDSISDISGSVRKSLTRENTISRIKKGDRVAIAAGSREIKNLDYILFTLAEELKKRGAEPFIFPAMGSHGGATAEGQLEILRSYGITEAAMQVPIYSSMETVEVGKTGKGLAVQVDKTAFSADSIIPVNRIKPHPEFRGRYESGLMKMLAIGVGKQYGAYMCHQLGMRNMSGNIEAFGRVILNTCNIPFGIAVIENALHETYLISAVPSERLPEEEPELLLKAKELVPVVPFEKVDVIICEEMGKDISGTGMDSNVIGRSISLGISKPFAERIGIFDLTTKSHGNFNGVGLGDAISKELFDKMSFPSTYPNTITACEPFAVKIPPVMDNDKLCAQFCIKTCLDADNNGIKVVWLKNTLSLDGFFISEALLREGEANPAITIENRRYLPQFDKSGRFSGFT